jgi:hypothetical protein
MKFLLHIPLLLASCASVAPPTAPPVVAVKPMIPGAKVMLKFPGAWAQPGGAPVVLYGDICTLQTGDSESWASAYCPRCQCEIIVNPQNAVVQ